MIMFWGYIPQSTMAGSPYPQGPFDGNLALPQNVPQDVWDDSIPSRRNERHPVVHIARVHKSVKRFAHSGQKTIFVAGDQVLIRVAKTSRPQ